MPTVYIQEFEVEGSGDFPFDMFRYDQCYPVREGTDTGQMSTPSYGRHPLPKRVIKLERIMLNKHQMPTSDRWKSFLWRVVEGSVKTRKI